MARRCDGKPQCLDKSDEDECNLITIDKDLYSKKYPPIDYQELDVKIKVILRSVYQLNELDMTFSSKIGLILEWHDERITFSNLKSEDFTNLVEYEKASDIWIPPLVFNNTKDDWKVVLQRTADLFVNRRGAPEMAGRSSINEDYLFTGADNVLVYRINYDMTYNCVYVLEAYPFDTQKCQIEVLKCFVSNITTIIFINIYNL